MKESLDKNIVLLIENYYGTGVLGLRTRRILYGGGGLFFKNYKDKETFIEIAREKNYRIAVAKDFVTLLENDLLPNDLLWLPDKSRLEVSKIIETKSSYIHWMFDRPECHYMIPKNLDEAKLIAIYFGGSCQILKKVKDALEEDEPVYFENGFGHKAIFKTEIAKQYVDYINN